MPIIVGYLGIAMWMRIATVLEPVFGKNKYVNLLADNTYSIMMNQFLGFMIVKTIYGVCAKLFPVFTDFDFVSYENNLWWYYTPQRIGYTRIFYLLAAIIFSVCVQYAINFVKGRYRKIKGF